MRTVRIILLAAGAVGLLALAYRLGAGSIAAALARIAWWQFGLLCVIHGIGTVIDVAGWRFAFAHDRVPFAKLLAARCAGDAVNVLSAAASVGGEPIKAWVLRHEVPYEESVPSLILSKTSEVMAQVLLLAIALVVVLATGIVGHALTTAMVYLLLIEVVGVGGFVWVQVAGVVGKTGRLLSWAGVGGHDHMQQLDLSLRNFYRKEWRRFLVSLVLQLASDFVGVVEVLIILYALGLGQSVGHSLAVATVIDALWSAVRFVTFFVPGSVGPLEGANAAVFRALGLGASVGLAFALVRRARQAVWIGLGVVILLSMRSTRTLAGDSPNEGEPSPLTRPRKDPQSRRGSSRELRLSPTRR